MINLQNKTYSEYQRDGDLSRLEQVLNDYSNQSREMDSAVTVDLEKHLWLANGAAVTVTIGFIQAATEPVARQYTGAWCFLIGIFFLVALKFISSVNSSRDAARFNEARSRFEAEEVTDYVFREVRDSVFKALRRIYLTFQYSSGIAFVAGCIFVLTGIYAV